jgi:hypothetical protein
MPSSIVASEGVNFVNDHRSPLSASSFEIKQLA